MCGLRRDKCAKRRNCMNGHGYVALTEITNFGRTGPSEKLWDWTENQEKSSHYVIPTSIHTSIYRPTYVRITNVIRYFAIAY